jgi:hypothetical protein
MRYTSVFLILLFSLFVFTYDVPAKSNTADYQKLVGNWVRPDGNYTIHVRDVKPDGIVYAGYFNPGEIHVAESNASMWKGRVKLFIKLDDKGYPGSTYNLYYYPEKDAPAGFYCQALLKQTFEVVFIRQ